MPKGYRLRPIQPRGLTEDVAQALRTGIVGGRFRRGERLVETKLAAELQVSRGPIREALRMLRGEGLVQESRRRGAFVVALSEQDVSEIYDLRATLEGHAAALLATRLDDRSIAELRRRLDAIGEAVEQNDPRTLWIADIDFHEAICRLSGNNRLYVVMRAQMQVLRALFLSEGFPHDEPHTTAASHRSLLDTILSGDAEEAAEAVTEHAISARGVVLQYLTDRGDAPTKTLAAVLDTTNQKPREA